MSGGCRYLFITNYCYSVLCYRWAELWSPSINGWYCEICQLNIFVDWKQHAHFISSDSVKKKQLQSVRDFLWPLLSADNFAKWTCIYIIRTSMASTSDVLPDYSRLNEWIQGIVYIRNTSAFSMEICHGEIECSAACKPLPTAVKRHGTRH